MMNKSEIVDCLTHIQRYSSLIHKSEQLTRMYFDREIYLRGVIEFSNICIRNCLYCGLRRDNSKLKRYRMSMSEIDKTAQKIIEKGIKTVILQSGDDPGIKAKDLAKVIKLIKKRAPAVAITLSIGERSFDEYRCLRDSGADRYLLKHETANSKLYAYLHPSQKLKQRIKTLLFLKKIGYQIGSGNIIGLPGQTPEDLAEDILLMKNLAVDMAAVGPFFAQSQTPLANYPSPNVLLVYQVIALTRILLGKINIPATTALATLGQKKAVIEAFKAGANVIMCNFTPANYRKNYKIYDHKNSLTFTQIKSLLNLTNKEWV
ncbi:MAG: [FeFe] hydrogenase H-cluster radical SAM maturase HydE [Candidatus Omnitrophica bacterium]|nr:[FeFe] hydrogenase H-cluster radical SAM maturase HydE [Candidatus Omnitrophota bacterium]